ncbi:polysaccharide deacetylase family protein [Saccharicrinis sp. FJH2]|uniref:polysaccharide deacetylase family protein n=1 Tax=Saccharicrinis sp. FJH65 TaxID=3344659 RepID=UPI0035F42B24
MNMIKKTGYFLLILLSFQSCKFNKSEKSESGSDAPIIVLTFDDAVISHYTYVAPLLKQYGFGGTFFICEYPRRTPADTLQYMNWNQISKLNNMGFEIGNHTRTHKHVNSMHRSEMEEQIAYIEDKCKAYNIPKPVSFAYPGYDTASLAKVVLKDMGYTYARIGGSRNFVPAQDNLLLIPSYSTTGSDENAKIRIMDILKNSKPGDIIVFTIHGVPDIVHPHVNTSPELFSGYLKYMHDHGYKVIAMRDLKNYIP